VGRVRQTLSQLRLSSLFCRQNTVRLLLRKKSLLRRCHRIVHQAEFHFAALHAKGDPPSSVTTTAFPASASPLVVPLCRQNTISPFPTKGVPPSSLPSHILPAHNFVSHAIMVIACPYTSHKRTLTDLDRYSRKNNRSHCHSCHWFCRSSILSY
jgi:hypothetical protein